MKFTRRAVLSIGLSLSIAGCPTIDTERSRSGNQIEVFVGNLRRENITITVKATDESGTILFNHTYQLRKGHADESKSVPTDSQTIEAIVEDGPQEKFEFSVPLECEHPQVNIWVRTDSIDLNNGCPPS